MKRSPIRKVSKKRSKAWAEYLVRRKRFLSEHPHCQVFLLETFVNTPSNTVGMTLADAEALAGVSDHNYLSLIPKSTEIHHRRKPKATYLNDESTWLAVCREMHEKIENHKGWAREKGYLDNI